MNPLVIDGNSTIVANSSDHSLTNKATQPEWTGPPPTKTALRQDRGMIPIDVKPVQRFQREHNHFVQVLSRPIFVLVKTKNKRKHPAKYFTNKFKFTIMITMKELLEDNVLLTKFSKNLRSVKHHLSNDHANCNKAC